MTWKLMSTVTGNELTVGTAVRSFRGEPMTIKALHPPHKPESGGKVTVVDERGVDGTYYASVIDARFMRDE
jgi:hypothetical protein